MPISDALAKRPRILAPTLPLSRIQNAARGLFLSNAPLYLASHWRTSRSFPCLATILTTCPWCAGCESRHHAYFPCLLKWDTTGSHRVILELPARAMPEIDDLYGKVFIATRRTPKAPVTIELDDAAAAAATPPPRVDHRETLRTIAKVYALPDPAAYATEQEWIIAVHTRANDPDYTPKTRLTPGSPGGYSPQG